MRIKAQIPKPSRKGYQTVIMSKMNNAWENLKAGLLTCGSEFSAHDFVLDVTNSSEKVCIFEHKTLSDIKVFLSSEI